MAVYEGDNSLKCCEDWIDREKKNRNLSICAAVFIDNRSSKKLEFVTFTKTTGYPAFDVKNAFKTEDGCNYFLPPGATGAQLWRNHHGGNFGKWIGDIFSLGISASKATSHVLGYFSVRVKTEGKNFVIPCGFNVGRNRCNKAGVQIRGTDGPLDDKGNVVNGVDPTGSVTDIGQLVAKVHYSERSGYQIHVEQTSSIKIIVKFDNKYLGRFYFIFEDGDKCGNPVGVIRKDHRKPKYDSPCNEYTNILNHDRLSNEAKTLNTDRHLNTDKDLSAYKPIVFKSSDDILEILKSHPEIQRLPKSCIEAIVAAILSAIAAGVGFILTIKLGGIGALGGANLTLTAIVELAGANALASGGASGFLNAVVTGGIHGKFTWTEWVKDVGIAVLPSLIVFPLAIEGGCISGSIPMSRLGNLGDGLLIQWGKLGSHNLIKKYMQAATTAIYSLGQSGMNAISQWIKEGRINVPALLASLVVGAFSGYSIGNSVLVESQITNFIEEQIRRLNCFFEDAGQRHLLPEGVIRALIDYGKGHTVEFHGPNALLAKPQDTCFTTMDDLYALVHDSVASGNEVGRSLVRGCTRFQFDFRLSDAQRSIFIRGANSANHVEFSGVVRTVVDLQQGEIPVIVTSFPAVTR